MSKSRNETLKMGTYRLSSSLIVATKTGDNCYDWNYEVLMIKRSDRTASLKEQCVFPGGMFESTDESECWLAYFKEFGVREIDLQDLILPTTVPRPCILETSQNTRVAREISTRINCLRETFEEVGILLCCSRQQVKNLSVPHCASYKDDFDKDYWQHRVHNDSSEFLQMCRELQVVPDLWALYEWSAWASPPTVRKANETLFYVTFLHEKPIVKIELSEAKDFLWKTPMVYLQLHREGAIGFWPPQFYELSRLYSEKSFQNLLKFSQKRNCLGIALFMHVIYVCTDGTVSVLPGDDLYPEDPRSILKPQQLEATMDEFRKQSKRICRIENLISLNPKIRINVQPMCGQLTPWTGDEHERSML